MFDGKVQITVPMSPTGGVTHGTPLAPVLNETNVVFVGTESVITTPVAASGPLFVIVTSWVIVPPADASGGPVLTTDTSAEHCARSLSGAARPRRARAATAIPR